MCRARVWSTCILQNSPERSASALLTPTLLICRLIYLVGRTKTVYSDGLMSPTESWTSAGRALANSLRLQMSGSDAVHHSQIPLIRSTMAQNEARPFPCSAGEAQPDLSNTRRGRVTGTELEY